MVGNSRNYKHTERWEERPEEVERLGMDIGDYSFIDSLMHCPMANWVAQGKVLATLKDQKSCGSCWAHSTLAAVENLYARENHIDDATLVPSFSEQELVDCDLYPNIGCYGGQQIYAFNYTKNNGISLSSDYPYIDEVGECNPSQEKAF